MKLKQRKFSILYIILFLFTLLAIYKKIFYGVEPDEQYFIAMLYKLSDGNYLFRDFYEPHQLSILLSYILFKIKNLFISGYDILYFRGIGLLLNTIASIAWYKTLKEKENFRYLISLFVLLFTPKFTYTFDYAMQMYIFTNLLIVTILSKNKYKNILIGLFSTLLILAYPPMFIVIILGLILYRHDYKRTSLLIGTIISVITLLSLIGFTGFKLDVTNILNIISDAAHNLSLFDRIRIQLNTVGFQFLLLIGFWIVFYKASKSKKIRKKDKEKIIISTVVFLILLSLYQILIRRNQLDFEVRWIIITILLFFLCEFKSNVHNKLILLSICMMIISFFSANQGQLMFIRYGISFVIILLYINCKYDVKRIALNYCILSIILSYCILSTNSFYNTQSKNEIITNYTPLQGIYVHQDMNFCFQEFFLNTENLQGTVCIIGNNTCLNLNTNLKLHQPSCISTPVFDENVVKYFDRTFYPDYVFCETNFQNGIVDKIFYEFIIKNYTPIKENYSGVLYIKNMK